MTDYSGSTAMKVNLADFLALPPYIIACSVLMGALATPDWVPIDLAATWDITAGYGISIATLAALACLAYVAQSNDWSGNLSWVQAWIMIATVILIVAPPIVPLLAGSFAEGPARLVALVIQIGGFAAFSFVG